MTGWIGTPLSRIETCHERKKPDDPGARIPVFLGLIFSFGPLEGLKLCGGVSGIIVPKKNQIVKGFLFICLANPQTIHRAFCPVAEN